MHLYTYVSLAVVVLSTATLYIILKRNKSTDCRYIIGLGISAVVAFITSLLLPDIVSAFTVDLAMKLALSFFIALLIYITLLFFSMMLVSYIFPQKKIDVLKKKWEEKRLERQKSKELKQKQKEEIENIKPEAAKPETELRADESETETSREAKQQEEPATRSEPILKSIFINRFSRQKAGEIFRDPVQDDQKEFSESDSIKDEISETAGGVYEDQLTDKETGIDMDSDAEQEPIEQEGIDKEDVEQKTIGQESIEQEDIIIAHDELEKTIESVQEDKDIIGASDDGTLEETDSTTIKTDVEAAEPVNDFKMVYSDEESLKPADTELSEQEDIFEQAALLLEQAIDSSAYEDRKNVDTQDIIDKMGVDEISSDSVPYLDLNGLSLNDLIDKAFLLKQEGRESEAVSLYMEALNRNPDDEAAFWIVLDICSIYKNSGQTELAEDILLTYIDEFEHIMSEEVKDQILQSLYS
ncbi:MAG: hypothetical protein GX045_07150 [Clostridiaceae bacterium]|nr:hypothetical protein [Clostridiaceae bacterium]